VTETQHEHVDDESATGETSDGSSPDADGDQADSPSSDAAEMPTDAVMTTEGEAKGKPQGRAQFGKLSPSEAARVRWEQERARKTAREEQEAAEHGDEAVVVRTSVATGKIIRKLAQEAARGNVGAARELRGWLAEVAQDEETSVSALDRRTRQAVLARVLAEIEEEEAQAVEGGQPQGDATPASAGTPVV
jgi:hypothetical protein